MENIREALNFSLAHIGINCENEEEALASAKLFESIFGFAANVGNSSVFTAERTIELTKKKGLGKCGHIAIATSDIDLAQKELEANGYSFIEETRVIKNGKTIAIYLAQEIAGFAIHLLQK